MSKIIGISFGHSAAAVLIEDNKLLFAIEEEKLTRIKGHITFPSKSIEYILNKRNLKPEDIDFVAVGCENIFEFGHSILQIKEQFGNKSYFFYFIGKLINLIKTYFWSFDDKKLIEKYFYYLMNKKGFSKQKIHLVNHHLSHAASAYYLSNFSESIVFTQDGKGDFACGGLYYANQRDIKLKERINHHNSIGQFYQTVTKYLGFKPNRHEGKITGLAAYGSFKKTYPILKSAFNFENDNLVNKLLTNVNTDPIRFFNKNITETDWLGLKYLKQTNKSLRKFNLSYNLYYNFLKNQLETYSKEDIASGIQKLTEETIVGFLKSRLNKDKNYNICLAGGVFANVKLNQKIREIKNIKNVFVQPAMDDSGTALGSALIINKKTSKKNLSFDTIYLGPSYEEKIIIKAIDKYDLNAKKVKKFHSKVAHELNLGKVVGRFSDRLEWGPRALGNRSILVKPDDPKINDVLNRRLNRTEFMPFAPIILEEDASKIVEKYSKEHISSKFMTMTYDINTKYKDKIKAAIHVDNTARPQVLNKYDNSDIYKILKHYKKLTGIGVILNTSFNLHEEPIVNTPDDAIKAFISGAVDILSIEDYIIYR